MDRNQMDNSEIDRILAAEQELIPSSGFLATVMESVHDAAKAPPPIPFPWKRAIPGILLATGVLGWCGFELVRNALPAIREISLAVPPLSAAVVQPLEQAGWVALALAVSLAACLVSRRLAGQPGLL